MIFQKKVFTDKNIWVVSCMCFVAGVVLPMFTFSKLIVFNDTFSLLGGIINLLKEGEVFLFLIVFTFSIVGPTYKLKIIHDLLRRNEKNKEMKLRSIKILAVVGKWSMADVFVIAILVSTVKLGMLASVTVHIGIVFFGMSVLLSMVLVQRLMSDYELRPKE